MTKRFSSIVILTGAGISAESGVETFRDKKGIWSRVDHREVATPEGFARNPGKVHDFYNQRRRRLICAQPNDAHMALERLEREFDGDFLLVTQNIDDLHETAGSRRLIHMHGELNSAVCQACGDNVRWKKDLTINSTCPRCRATGFMREDVVWFGEMPRGLGRIQDALANCDLFVAIGTSGNVYPAAGFIEEARYRGAHTIELNLEPSDSHQLFDETAYGRATQIVPAFVDRLLSKS